MTPVLFNSMTIKFPKDSYLNIYSYLKFSRGSSLFNQKLYVLKKKKPKGRKMRQYLAICNQIGYQNFETL